MRNTCLYFSKKSTLSLVGLLLFLSAQCLLASPSNDPQTEQSHTKQTLPEQELATINAEISLLPKVSREQFHGSGGYLVHHPNAGDSNEDSEIEIRIEWPEERLIDLIALVPARSFGISGVKLQHRMPDQYDLQLLKADGSPAGPLIIENNAWKTDQRSGYPFLYQLSKPQQAKSLRIRVHTFSPLKNETIQRAGWAEVLCFEESANVALNSTVTSSPNSPPLGWRWAPHFLVDGITGMGFPQQAELNSADTGIGWISHALHVSDANAWVQLDLGARRAFDALRLFPAIRPNRDKIPGFGLPKRFQVLTSNDGEDWVLWIDRESKPSQNPGQHPAEFRGSSQMARFVKIQSVELWSISDYYPKFFGFSEIEVLDQGRNIALGAAAEVFERSETIAADQRYFWSPAGLTDGQSVSAKILPTRVWLERLEKRQELEEKRDELNTSIVNQQTRRRHLVFQISVGLGIFGIIAAIVVLYLSRRRVRLYRRNLKARLAGELHDDLGSNLGCILSLSQAIERDHSKLEKYTPRIRRMAIESTESIRDLVQTLREEPIPVGEVPDRIRSCAEQMLSGIKWSFDTTEEASQFRFTHAERHNLLLFIREAFHNCLRHANADSIAIRMYLNDNDLVLRLEDDGDGIAPLQLAKKHTLFALKERTKQLNATLMIETETGKGLCLILKIKHRRPKRQ